MGMTWRYHTPPEDIFAVMQQKIIGVTYALKKIPPWSPWKKTTTQPTVQKTIVDVSCQQQRGPYHDKKKLCNS